MNAGILTKRILSLTAFFLCVAVSSGATDSIRQELSDSTETVQPKRNIIQKVIHYFEETNRPKADKPFDVSFIGGPYYSSDTKFGLGLVAAGLYSTDRTDSLLMRSDVSLYLKATTSMAFTLGLRGNNIFPHDSSRLIYDINFSSITTKYWGVGYYMNIEDANESKYKYFNTQAEVAFVFRLAPSFYIGPLATVEFIQGRDFKRPELWAGEPKQTFNLGLGFTVQFDSRDYITAPSEGIYFRFDQRFNPRFMFNRYAFSLSELTFSTYRRLWRGSVLAFQLHSRLTYGNTPWGLLSTLGGSDVMRGYFEGRFRDKSEIDFCLELRQHVYHRNGLVAWVGAGSVFPKFSAIRLKKILPNYGIGYRWEFKDKVNVRLDLGFGRHQTGFIFSINEAF